jgi:hypothetical protein
MNNFATFIALIILTVRSLGLRSKFTVIMFLHVSNLHGINRQYGGRFWRWDKGGAEGPERGAQRRVGGVWGGSPSPALGVRGYYPRKIFQIYHPNPCILMHICGRM